MPCHKCPKTRLLSISGLHKVLVTKRVHAAGSNTDRQDFAGFVTRAVATKHILSRVLAMLSAIQPQLLPSIVLKRSDQNEAELCFAPDPLLNITPVQIAQPVQHMVRQVQTTAAVPTMV